MALYVNTNVSSLNAQRKLTNATNNLNVSYQRLSSGLRINSSKDDAAGLQISDRLTSQINGLNQGNRNANDGIALAQTIEGAAVQAATGTNTEKDRQALQEEVTSLCQEITRIANKTTFAGQPILNGTKSVTDGGLLREYKANTAAAANTLGNDRAQLFFQVGANAYDELTLDLQGFAMSQIAQEITLSANNTKYEKMANSAGAAINSTAFAGGNAANFLSVGLVINDPENPGFRWSTLVSVGQSVLPRTLKQLSTTSTSSSNTWTATVQP